MKNRFLLIAALFGYSLMANSCAKDCSKLESEAEMRRCISEEYNQLDKQLNKIYFQYRLRLNDAQKQQLKETQLAWIKYRDLSCDFEASGVKGGDAYPMVRTQCLSQRTRARNAELENLLTCKEGDLSCPVWQ